MADVAPDKRSIGIGDKVGAAAAAVDAGRGNLTESGPPVAAGGVDHQQQSAQTGDNGNWLEESSQHCECSQWIGRQRDNCEGFGREGRPDPTPAAVKLWRSRNCKRTTVQDGSPEIHWNPSQPSRGLGDTVAKLTHAIGLDAAAESIAKAVTGKPCGCHGDKGRQGKLNRLLPYRSEGENRPS